MTNTQDQSEYREKNKKRKAEYDKEYYLKNKEKINKRQKNRRKKYPWKTILRNIKARCNNPKCKEYKWYGGKGIKCLITEKELKKLWFRDKAYLMEKPSISRKNHNKNYIFDNCKFEEKLDNVAERNIRVLSKPVYQFDLQDNFIKEWSSAMEIERKLNISNVSINACCNEKIKTSHGFIWKFKEKLILN